MVIPWLYLHVSLGKPCNKADSRIKLVKSVFQICKQLDGLVTTGLHVATGESASFLPLHAFLFLAP